MIVTVTTVGFGDLVPGDASDPTVEDKQHFEAISLLWAIAAIFITDDLVERAGEFIVGVMDKRVRRDLEKS